MVATKFEMEPLQRSAERKKSTKDATKEKVPVNVLGVAGSAEKSATLTSKTGAALSTG